MRRSTPSVKASNAPTTSSRSSPRSSAKWFRVPAGMQTWGTSRRAATVATSACDPSPPAMPMTSAPRAMALSASSRRSSPGRRTIGSMPRRRASAGEIEALGLATAGLQVDDQRRRAGSARRHDRGGDASRAPPAPFAPARSAPSQPEQASASNRTISTASPCQWWPAQLPGRPSRATRRPRRTRAARRARSTRTRRRRSRQHQHDRQHGDRDVAGQRDGGHDDHRDRHGERHDRGQAPRPGSAARAAAWPVSPGWRPRRPRLGPAQIRVVASGSLRRRRSPRPRSGSER